MTTDTKRVRYSPPITYEEAELRLADYRILQLARDAGVLTDEGEGLCLEGTIDGCPPKPAIRCTPGYESWYDGTAIKRPDTETPQITPAEIAARGIFYAEIDAPGHVPRTVDAAAERYSQILEECRLLHRDVSRLNDFIDEWRDEHDH